MYPLLPRNPKPETLCPERYARNTILNPVFCRERRGLAVAPLRDLWVSEKRALGELERETREATRLLSKGSAG